MIMTTEYKLALDSSAVADFTFMIYYRKINPVLMVA